MKTLSAAEQKRQKLLEAMNATYPKPRTAMELRSVLGLHHRRPVKPFVDPMIEAGLVFHRHNEYTITEKGQLTLCR
jgi:predicted transcriptional regulator